MRKKSASLPHSNDNLKPAGLAKAPIQWTSGSEGEKDKTFRKKFYGHLLENYVCHQQNGVPGAVSTTTNPE